MKWLQITQNLWSIFVENRRLVLIEWSDAWADTDNFSSAHGIIQSHAPMIVQTLGWVIQDDEVGISVVNELSTEDGKSIFRGRTFIPRAMVQKVTEFTLSKPRKKKDSSPPE